MSTGQIDLGNTLLTSLPSTITYRDVQDLGQQHAGRCWSLFDTPIEKLGILLRNAFFLPVDFNLSSQQNTQSDDFHALDHELAKKVTGNFTARTSSSSNEVELIQSHFSMRDIQIRIDGDIPKIFTVRSFVSKQPVNQKKLQLILFSFYGNQEEVEGSPGKWNPLSLKELSKSPLQVLKAFQNQGVKADSLITASLGNVFWDSFRTASPLASDREAVPSTIVINRGLASVKKVAAQYFFPLNYLLYGAGKLTGWDADPEQGLLNFFESEIPKKRARETTQSQTEILPLNSRPPRKVMIIEAVKDFYFSGAGGFASDYHKKLSDLGGLVYRACFYPFPLHPRAHHAISLDRLTHNHVTKTLANTALFSAERDEKVSSFIAKNIFLAGEENFHTCLYVCGNDVTLDIGTVCDSFPLLEAFIREGTKVEEKEKKAS